MKVQIVRREAMSKQGRANWQNKWRRKIRPLVFRTLRPSPLLLDTATVNTLPRLAEWVWEKTGEHGYYIAQSWRHSRRTRYRAELFTLLKVEFLPNPGGIREYKAVFHDIAGLARQSWFVRVPKPEKDDKTMWDL